MTNYMKKLIFFALLVAFSLTLSAAKYDIRLFDITGEYYNSKKIRSAINTQYIIVDFFSATCSPCRKSLPKLNRLHKKYNKKGVMAVVVAQPAGFDDEKEELAKLKQFAKKHHLRIPILFDTWQKVAERYKVGKEGGYDVPQYFILDKKGAIIFTTKKWKDIEKKIKQLIR
ncbi:TlpA family protein disulfide reductase [bacterium]|nr:TlpA family protein disulfide reductase [bacterium]